jgi:SAM-dependent methyltransferase
VYKRQGRVGAKWAELAGPLEAMLATATALLAERVGPVRGLRLLDVGCGAGASCRRWLDAGAEVTGLDVSADLLAVAAARTAGEAVLVKADAADWRGEAPFDLLVSQFGVMFFSDPPSAFANLAANLAPGGRLIFCCWRPVAENAWVTVPMGALHDLLPAAPPAAPDAPGPFALADRNRLAALLEQAGFGQVRITAHDIDVVMSEAGGVDAALAMALQVGPAAAALVEAAQEVRPIAKARLREALSAHEAGGRVALGGAIWLVEAVRPAEESI